MYDQLLSEARRFCKKCFEQTRLLPKTNIFFSLLDNFLKLKAAAEVELNEIYDKATTTEWIGQHLEIYIEKLNKILAVKMIESNLYE